MDHDSLNDRWSRTGRESSGREAAPALNPQKLGPATWCCWMLLVVAGAQVLEVVLKIGLQEGEGCTIPSST